MEMAADEKGDDEKGDDEKGGADEPRPDVVLLQGPTDDGAGVRVLRARENRLETGEIRPLKDGQPLVAGEVVKLVPREKSRVCDVQVIAKIGAKEAGVARAATSAQVGPAQVATRAYRDSWDRIFGEPVKREALLN
jgi:hypothetical protein